MKKSASQDLEQLLDDGLTISDAMEVETRCDPECRANMKAFQRHEMIRNEIDKNLDLDFWDSKTSKEVGHDSQTESQFGLSDVMNSKSRTEVQDLDHLADGGQAYQSLAMELRDPIRDKIEKEPDPDSRSSNIQITDDGIGETSIGYPKFRFKD